LTLPQISSRFQFVGDGSGTTDAAANAVLLGSALIVFTTLVNAFGVKLMARINSAGVFIELVAAVVLIILFAAHFHRGPGVVLDTQGHGAGQHLGYFGAFLTASLASAYVTYGFDTASSLGEESLNPARNAPRAILRALIASFLTGGLILLFALMATPDLNAPQLSVDGLQYVVLSTLGHDSGQAVLWCVAIAVTVCALAVHTAGIRLAFAMARDNNLPGGPVMARVNPRTQTPILPAVLIGILAIAILVVNINQPQIFSVVTSIAIIMIYLAYLLVTLPMLVQRLRGNWHGAGKGRFSLGRFGLPVNLLVVLWGTAMTINLMWPDAAVYNASGPRHCSSSGWSRSAASPATGWCSGTVRAYSPNTRHLRKRRERRGVGLALPCPTNHPLTASSAPCAPPSEPRSLSASTRWGEVPGPGPSPCAPPSPGCAGRRTGSPTPSCSPRSAATSWRRCWSAG
jgi:urea carboxylase system permease